MWTGWRAGREQTAASPAALSHETIEGGSITTTKYWCPGCLASYFFPSWVESRRWNVNKSMMARSWELQLRLGTIKRLFMLPWRPIAGTAATQERVTNHRLCSAHSTLLPLSGSFTATAALYFASFLFFSAQDWTLCLFVTWPFKIKPGLTLNYFHFKWRLKIKVDKRHLLTICGTNLALLGRDYIRGGSLLLSHDSCSGATIRF